MNVSISSTSVVYVRAAVSATVLGANYNPTADVVAMAFLLAGAAPVLGDWKVATWETVGTSYNTRILVGPGTAVALVAGIYNVWVKITDAPEIPSIMVGTLTVY